MAEKIFIDGVNFYQFAAVVEEEILNQDFPSADEKSIRLASRRTLNETETAHRLEIGIGRSFIPPITLDCRSISSDRLMVTPACNTDYYRPAFEKLLGDIRLYWGIPQPTPPAAQPAPLPPEPAQTEDLSSPPQPTRRVDRSMNVGTAEAVAEAKQLIASKGLTKTAACELVGIDRRTYNRWCDHEAVDSLLEDMQDHPPDQ
jgi:hypothetical protein